MNDDSMSRAQVKELAEAVAENIYLKIENGLTIKFEEYGNKQKEEQRMAREDTFEKGTGFPWEDRDRVKAALSYADRAQKNSVIWKGAGVIAITGLIITELWRNMFGA